MIGSLFRLLRSTWVLARHDALLPREYQARLPFSARLFGRTARVLSLGNRKGRPGERFARAMEKLGPAHVKLGQFLATRADIFGEAFATDLSRLKDAMEPIAPQKAWKQVLAEFGEDAASHFHAADEATGASDAIFPPALAAASIAQVHKVETPDGVRAMKLLRPGIEKRIAKDMKAFALGASILERMVRASRRLEPKQFVDTLRRSLTLETDFRLEAAAMSELSQIARPLKAFRVPDVDWERTGRSVLTMEWVEGAKLTDAQALAALKLDRAALAVTAVQSFLTTALDHGVFHADMHEGNLFASPDGALVAVDFGIVGRLGRNERRYLAEILWGFIRRDYRRIAEVHFEAGYVPGHHAVDEFASALRAAGEPIFGKAARDVSMGRVLLQLFEITHLFDMHLRPELVLLQKTMVQVEGVARGLDPAHDIWASAKPVLERYIRRELGPEGLAGDLLDGAREGLRFLRALPDAGPRLEMWMKSAEAGKLSLSDEAIERLAAAQARHDRSRSRASWVIAFAAVAAVLVYSYKVFS